MTQTEWGYYVNLMENNNGVLGLFGGRVAGLRKSQGLSQEAVASRMREHGHDWHQTTVSKVENGQRPVVLEEAYDLALSLDRHLRDFLAGESSEHEETGRAYELAAARLEEARRTLEDAQRRVEEAERNVQRVMDAAPRPGRKAPRKRGK